LSKHKLDISKWNAFLLIIAGSILVSILACKSMDGSSPSQAEVQENVDSILKSTPIAVKTSPEHPSIGPSSAPITIVEFSDFQCPYCKIGAYAVHSAVNAHLGKVRIEFRNFPLDSACNPEIQQSPHPVACEAAKVALCSNREGKFEALHDEFFDKQTTFAPGVPINLAKTLGLGGSPFDSCVASPETIQVLNRDISEAISLGIKSTPTFFVNGYRVEGAYPVAIWNLLFDRLLAKP
jgi:protein-disulfide isomerase